MATRLSKAYLLTKVLTATRVEVIVYLIEGAIGYLHKGSTALREGRRDDAALAIERAVSILIELSGNLNYSVGGQVSLRLGSIYNYLIESLTLALSRGDVKAVEACESVLLILHDAWHQAASLDGESGGNRHSGLQVSA